MEAYLTVDDLCDMLKVKKSFVYNLTHLGHIPFYKVGKQFRFKRSEIIEWLERKHFGKEQIDGKRVLAGEQR